MSPILGVNFRLFCLLFFEPFFFLLLPLPVLGSKAVVFCYFVEMFIIRLGENDNQRMRINSLSLCLLTGKCLVYGVRLVFATLPLSMVGYVRP